MGPWKSPHSTEKDKRSAFRDAVFPRPGDNKRFWDSTQEETTEQYLLASEGPSEQVWQHWDRILADHGYTRTTWPFKLTMKKLHKSGMRLCDGAFVVIKFVLWRKYRIEVDVVRKLLSNDLVMPELNRTPYLDVIDVPFEDEGGASLIVSEVCVEHYAWADQTHANDMLHSIRQLAEAVHFLHANGIAHCDIWQPNVVIRLPLRRPLQWTFIDFNSAVVAKDVKLDAPSPTITPMHHTGMRFEAPEFYAPYWTRLDPFAFDIYCFGVLAEAMLKDGYVTISANMRNLIDEMRDEDPVARPDSASVLSRISSEVDALIEGEDPEDALSCLLASSVKLRAHRNLYWKPHSLLLYLSALEDDTRNKDEGVYAERAIKVE